MESYFLPRRFYTYIIVLALSIPVVLIIWWVKSDRFSSRKSKEIDLGFHPIGKEKTGALAFLFFIVYNLPLIGIAALSVSNGIINIDQFQSETKEDSSGSSIFFELFDAAIGHAWLEYVVLTIGFVAATVIYLFVTQKYANRVRTLVYYNIPLFIYQLSVVIVISTKLAQAINEESSTPDGDSEGPIFDALSLVVAVPGIALILVMITLLVFAVSLGIFYLISLITYEDRWNI